VRLVQYLDEGATCIDAFDQVDAVEHGARGAVPLGHDEDVAGAELVDCLLEFGTAFDAPARGFLSEDDVDTFGAQGAKLPILVLMGAADPATAHFPHLISMLIF
jgi:hypothetical protein